MNFPHLTERKKDILCILFLFLLTMLFFWRAFFLGEYFNGGDIINQFYPWKYYLVDQVHSDRLPLWNPYTFGGNPFAANYQVGIWYPLDLLFFIVPISDGFRISIFLHFFLAGIFMYILSRHFKIGPLGSLVSGIIFTYGGFLIARLSSGNYTLLTTYPWIPIIFYLYDKFVKTNKILFLVLFSLALSSQILGGHPQPSYYTIFILFFYSLYLSYYRWKDRKQIQPSVTPFIYFILGIFLSLGLSAIQLLPSWELSQYSASRAGGAAFDFATFSSYNWPHFLLFLAPFIYGTSLGDTYWIDNVGYVEICGYISITALLLVFLAFSFYKNRTVLFFIIMVGISLLLALGKNLPLYSLFFNFFPGFRMFRCPGRWIMIVQFGMAFLAGFGFQQLLQFDKALFKKYICIFGIGLLIVIICFIYLYFDKYGVTSWLSHYQAKQLSAFYSIPVEQTWSMIPIDAMENRYKDILKQWGLVVLFFISACTIFSLTYFKKITSLWTKITLLLLIIIELMNFGFWFIITVEKEKFDINYQKSDGIQFLQKDRDLYRLITLDNVISWRYTTDEFEYRPNRLMLHQIQETRGYDPTILRHYSEYMNLLQNLPPETEPGGMMHIDNSNVLKPQLVNLLNVKYLNTMIYVPPTSNFQQPIFEGRVKLYPNHEFIPRAFFVPKALVISDKKERLEFLGKSDFHPKNILVLEDKPTNIPDSLFIKKYEISLMMDNSTSMKNSRIESLEYHSDYSIWDITMENDGFIFFSEIWYPGWKAFINNNEIPIYKANHAFRAIYLPQGKYHFEMKFLSISYYWGRKISELFILINIILLGIYFWNPVKKKYLKF